MKKIYYLIFLAIGLSGCSVESLDSTEEFTTADASAKIKVANTSTMVFLESVCAGEETLITVNFNQKTNSQGKNLPTNVKVDLLVDGEWTDIYRNNVNDLTSISFNYTFEVAKEYTLRFSAEEGPWNANQILTVNECCTESFSYIDNENGTYIFTYQVGEVMDDAELVFTFAQSAYVSGLSEDFSQNGQNGQTYKATMDLQKCDVLEYTITLQANCSGNSPNSNVWTDFKVNDVSKKNTNTPTLVQSCR